MAVEYPVFASVIDITSSNNIIRWEEGGVAFDVTVAAGGHFLADDDTTIGSILKAVKDALDTASAASGASRTYDVDYTPKRDPSDVGGTVVITCSAADTLQILDGGTTFPVGDLGWAEDADSAQASTTLTAPYTPAANWTHHQPAVLPDAEPPIQEGVTETFTAGGQSHVFVNGTIVGMWKEDITHAFDAWLRTASAPSSDPARAFETFWRRCCDGRRMRLYHVPQSGANLAALTSTYLKGTYLFTGGTLASMPTTTEVDFGRVFDLSVDLREYKA